jgi:hypothetical protein
MRIVDQDIDGNTSPYDTMLYDNEWENQLIGLTTGCQHEYYLGNGFAISCDGRLGIFANLQQNKTIVARGDDSTIAISVQERNLTFSPSGQLGVYGWWYPFEGIQIRAGYEVFGALNIRRSEHPVSFDLGHLDPAYDNQALIMDGFVLGFSLIF